MSDAQTLDLCWQVEEACALAWPAEQVEKHQGYEFRQTSSTPSRRINSVNPTSQSKPCTAALVADAERFYAGYNQSVIFRVPAIAEGLAGELTKFGFEIESAHTKTLLAPTLTSFEWQHDVQLTTHPDDKWLQFALERAHFPPDHRVKFRQALLNIGYPILFAHIEEDQELAAIAYAVVVEDIAIIESVETAPQFRRQGRAARLLSSLLAKCRRLGANKSALQVMSENVGALALYKKLGFSAELYDYHYRTKPSQDGA